MGDHLTDRRTFLTAIGTAIIATSAGCSEDKTEDEIMSELTDVKNLNGESVDVTRFIDHEAGVVLYQYYGYEKGGMTAVPIKDTTLL